MTKETGCNMNYELIRRKFLFKAKEFYQEKNLEKFNYSKKNIKFKNGNLMVVWFEKNKKEILESNEDICKKIQKQYKQYRESLKKSFEERQKEKLSEFCKEENSEKFYSNKKKLRFKDNAYMGFWFAGNKKEIFKSNEDICKKIQEQYKEYRKNLKESTIKNKVEEFYQEKDLEKFNCNKKNIKFKNGNLMAVWFNNNKKAILNSDDEICLKILRQYYEYKNKTDMINYADDKLEKINKGNSFVKQE